MSNIGIPMWVFQLQPRNSEAREPTIKATVLGSVLSIGTLKHSFLKFYAQQNLVNLVLTRYYLSMYILVYYHLYLHQD